MRHMLRLMGYYVPSSDHQLFRTDVCVARRGMLTLSLLLHTPLILFIATVHRPLTLPMLSAPPVYPLSSDH